MKKINKCCSACGENLFIRNKDKQEICHNKECEFFVPCREKTEVDENEILETVNKKEDHKETKQEQLITENIKHEGMIIDTGLPHMWQECPVCKGEGFRYVFSVMPEMFLTDATKTTPLEKQTCAVCLGQKIISNVFGTPPTKTIVNTKNK